MSCIYIYMYACSFRRRVHDVPSVGPSVRPSRPPARRPAAYRPWHLGRPDGQPVQLTTFLPAADSSYDAEPAACLQWREEQVIRQLPVELDKARR